MDFHMLDLFCGAGGATRGYQDAANKLGIDLFVTGVDIAPQPNYCGDVFWQADALNHLGEAIDLFYPFNYVDFIHASPPCQAHTNMKSMPNSRPHSDLIALTRDLLNVIRDEVPWVIENVVGAPLVDPVMLCGSMFGLDVQRHRLFESNFKINQPKCDHSVWESRFPTTGNRRRGRLAKVVHVFGQGNHHYSGEGSYERETQLRRDAMGMQWATREELNEAIPPAYTEYIGRQLFGTIGKTWTNQKEYQLN